jgi:hypothetical protein
METLQVKKYNQTIAFSNNNPLQRAEARKLFAQAVKKLEEN